MPRRFDLDLMQPPTPGAAVDEALLGRVRAWCETAGLPMAVAAIDAEAGLDAIACELDGTNALARLGRWRGLAWRLQLLARDHRPWRDPADCGWWRAGALAAAAAFRPRRATLLMVRQADAGDVDALLSALHGQSRACRQPLRVLIAAQPSFRSTSWASLG